MNKIIQKIYFMVLAVAVCILFFILFGSLRKPEQINTTIPLLGQIIPAFHLTDINPNQKFESIELRGHWSLINIWATWCSICKEEHPILTYLSKQIPLYSINYKDDRSSVLTWLKKYGNPYRKVGLDERGSVVLDLGVYGTPETFLVDPAGRIRYRHAGLLTEQIWEEKFLPLLKVNQ